MEVLVLGKDINVLKNFNSVDEFNLYYTKHKDEMDILTTQKLNKLYKIDGYRITKKDTRDKEGHLQQGIICLKKQIEKKEEKEDFKNEIDEINEKIQNLDKKMNIIAIRFNDLVDKLKINSLILE